MIIYLLCRAKLLKL